jgi:dolichol-phosphate mannosyltransferase
LGLPGQASRARGRIQANGQCFLVRRAALAQTGALSAARASRCEDVTIARCLAAHGVTVGFYESDDPAWVRMYGGWRETWQNWPRSLPLRDQYWHVGSILGLAEVTLVQALPMPLLTLLLALDARGRMASRAHTGQRATLSGRQQAETGDRRASTAWRQSQGVAPAPSLSGNGLHADSSRRRYRLLFVVNLVLLMARLGVLQGTARAYRARPWSYWLSPLCDLPVSVQLWRSLLRRRHTWRGRVLVPGVLV